MAIKKITSVDHAQEVLGSSINFEKMVSGMMDAGLPVKDIKPVIAQYKLWIITEANNKLNGNWKPDYTNTDQKKFSIWAPDVIKKANRPSGLGLAFSRTDYWSTRTIVGARLEVGSREEAEYIFRDFIELWDTAWLIQE